MRDQLGADSSRDGRVGGPAFHFRWSPRSLSGPLGPRERGGGRGLWGQSGARRSSRCLCGASQAAPRAVWGCCSTARLGVLPGLHSLLGASPPHTPTQHRSGGRQPARGQSQEIPPPTSNPKPGLSLCAPSPAAGPALGPPGGLPLFPCCTTVTVAASSAIMKGRQCAGERREPGPSW